MAATIDIIYAGPHTPVDTAHDSHITHGPITRETVFDITGDTSYPTGGYLVTAAQLGLQRIHRIMRVEAPGTPASGMCVTHLTAQVPDTDVLLEFSVAAAGSAGKVQATSTGDVSGTTKRMIALGN
jgi:hypothetical protein